MGQDQLEDTRTGDLIGNRFLVGSRLGKGAHGEVYRARDQIDQRDYAIKFLGADIADDNDFRLRLVREARVMSSLEGLATVEVFGVIGAEDGTPALVMELLDGVDLRDAIRHRRAARTGFTMDEVVRIFLPIVRTLDAAHAKDIVHRDIKPSNLFLNHGGVDDARIMDFGLAKAGDLASITADQMLAGSPSYIAPEIWKLGAKVADKRSDVYSLAVVMFETMTGDVPIYRESLIEMLMAVTEQKELPSLHALRPELPPEVDDWLAQALALDPNHRFQTVVAMWRAFRSVAGV